MHTHASTTYTYHKNIMLVTVPGTSLRVVHIYHSQSLNVFILTLHALQILESSTHSTAVAAEVALRMIFLRSSNDVAEDKMTGKDQKASSGNVLNTDSKKNSSTPHNDNKISLPTAPPSSAGKGIFFDRLTQEMLTFVASDTLNTLLVASSSNITAETLILV